MKKQQIKQFIMPYKKPIVLLFILGLFQYLIPLVFPLLTQTAIDDVFIGKSEFWSLEKILFCFLCLYIASIAISHINNVASDALTHNMMTHLRLQLFSHAQKLPKSYYDNESTGNIASRVNHDANDVSRLVQTGIISLSMNFIMMFVAVFILFHISWELTLISLIVFPLYYVLFKKSNHKTKSIWRNIAKERGNVTSKMLERLNGISVVKNFHQEQREIEEFHDALKDLRTENMKAEQAANMMDLVTGATNNLGNLIIWAIGGYMVLRHQMTVGELIAFQAYINSLYGPIRTLSSIQIRIQSAFSAMERIHDFLNIPTEKTGSLRRMKFDGHLKVENISFRYDQAEKETIKNVSFEAKKGETIAFVGESGGGKSTLFQLLTRFYEENDGTIFYGNVNAKEIHLGDLRKNIGIVNQDTFLFSGSVLENIRYGKPEATLDEVIAVAKAVGAHKFIDQLENQYETLVGERGVKLSGGQKQRISIARTLLNNPSILLLDEATSALDTETESIVVDALDHFAKDTTKLVIAHRLSTILRADRIYVIQNGRIVESGNHQDLLQKNAHYATLYKQQFA